MTVYILSAGYDYEGNAVIGVYNSREKAEQVKAEVDADPGEFDYDWTDIEEWEVE